MDPATFVFALIAIAGALMASNKVRYDAIALGVVIILIVFEILSVGQALAGFGSSVVIVVGGLLIVGEMLDRTGFARAVGDWIMKRGGTNETRLLVLIMASAALLGSVMSSTAIVAIFIPVVLRIASESGLSRSRMLMPMSYAALVSGMLTLIASPPNLVVSYELVNSGHQGLGFFSFTLIGLGVLIVAILYILLVGRFLLPDNAEAATGAKKRSIDEIWADYRIDEVFEAIIITDHSPLAGKQVAESRLESDYGIRAILRVRRGQYGSEQIAAITPGMELQPDDILLVTGGEENLKTLVDEQRLTQPRISDSRWRRWLWKIGAATVLIHPDSGLIGQSLVDAAFRSHYQLQVLGLRRDREPVSDYREVPLVEGDALLVVGPWSRIEQLSEDIHDFVLLDMPAEHAQIVPAYDKLPVALLILLGMVGLTLLNIVPLVVAVLLAAMAAVATGCLSADQAYRSISWSSLVLIAGMLPLADALQQTGGSQMIVDTLLGATGDSDPLIMMGMLFVLTALLGLVLSNTASAVLVAPIAVEAASALQVSPYPFCIAVLIAASAAYSTPVSTPVVTLVVAPGQYKFLDFVKVGVPLLVLTGAATLLLAPVVFPFQPS